MANSILNSDDGSVSGSAGLKFTAGDDGVLKIQNNGTDALTVSDAGVVTFAQQPVNPVPAFDVYLSDDQSVTSGANTLVELDTVVLDTNSWFSTSTYKYTPQIAGYYWIQGQIGVTGSAGMSLQAGYIYKNDAQYGILYIGRQTVNSSYYFGNGFLIYFNGTTDYVTLIGRTTNTGNPSLVGNAEGTAGCRMSGYFVRPA